jgi:hypothetical protein
MAYPHTDRESDHTSSPQSTSDTFIDQQEDQLNRYRFKQERQQEAIRHSIHRYNSATREYHQSVLRKKATKLPLRAMSRLSAWAGIGVAVTAYSIQLALSTISIFSLSIDYMLEQYWFLKPASWLMNIVSSGITWFFNIDATFSAREVFMITWGLAASVALCTFIGFLLWYFLTGVQVFRSVYSILITAICFGLAIMPFTNLFPWIVLWVVYVNITSLFNTVKDITRSS